MKDYMVKAIGVLIFAAIAFFTCPSKEKQKEKMMEELRVEMRKQLRHNHKPIPSSTRKLDKMVENRWKIYIDNYGVFTLGRIEEVEVGDKSFFSIGAFGLVYVRDLVLL